MDVLIILILVVIPQCICVSNHYVVHFKYIKLYLSISPQLTWKKPKKKQKSSDPLTGIKTYLKLFYLK